MSPERPDARCVQIRERMSDFLHERLGVVATGEVQGHLLTCQGCSETYGDLIMQEVESGTEPLRTPPRIPPLDWYDAYLRERSGQFGILWRSVRNALQATDVQMRAWAQERTEQVACALRQILNPRPSLVPATVRVRGAVRTRGAARQPRPAVMAEVLSATCEPRGKRVAFSVLAPPHVTADGRFRQRLTTETAGYEKYSVICTVTLSEGPLVSFSGTLRPMPGSRAWEVEIDEEGIPCGPGDLPLEQVSVTLVGPDR